MLIQFSGHTPTPAAPDKESQHQTELAARLQAQGKAAQSVIGKMKRSIGDMVEASALRELELEELVEQKEDELRKARAAIEELRRRLEVAETLLARTSATPLQINVSGGVNTFTGTNSGEIIHS